MTMKGRHTTTQVVFHIILIILAIITLYPLLFLLFNSFKDNNAILNTPIAPPSTWTLDYVKNAAQAINFGGALWITFLVTFFSILILVIVSSLAAWAMVRSKTKFAEFMYLMFAAAMLVPFQALMYPLVNMAENLNMKNLAGLIFMYGGFGVSMSIFLYHGFVKSIPASLEEAALIDGANLFQMFFKIVFPLMKSTTVTVIIVNAMWIWNDYLLPFLVIGNRQGVKTLTLELYFAKLQSGQYGNPWELIFPAVFVTIIPIIILYIALQKYIISGVVDGAVKT